MYVAVVNFGELERMSRTLLRYIYIFFFFDSVNWIPFDPVISRLVRLKESNNSNIHDVIYHYAQLFNYIYLSFYWIANYTEPFQDATDLNLALSNTMRTWSDKLIARDNKTDNLMHIEIWNRKSNGRSHIGNK